MFDRFFPDRYVASTYVIDFEKLYEEGYDVAVIQMILGHSDMNVTKRYIGVTTDEVNSILKKLKI